VASLRVHSFEQGQGFSGSVYFQSRGWENLPCSPCRRRIGLFDGETRLRET